MEYTECLPKTDIFLNIRTGKPDEPLTIKDRPWAIDSTYRERADIWFKWNQWITHHHQSVEREEHEEHMYEMYDNPELDEEPFFEFRDKDGTYKKTWYTEYIDLARGLVANTNRDFTHCELSGGLWDMIESQVPPDKILKNAFGRPHLCGQRLYFGSALLELMRTNHHYVCINSKYGNCTTCRSPGIVGQPCKRHLCDVFDREGVTSEYPNEGRYSPLAPSEEPCGGDYVQGFVCRFLTKDGKHVINPLIIEMISHNVCAPVKDEMYEQIMTETDDSTSNINIRWEPRWFWYDPSDRERVTFRQDVLIFHICKGSKQPKLGIALKNVENEIYARERFDELKQCWKNVFTNMENKREKDMRVVLRGLDDHITNMNWNREEEERKYFSSYLVKDEPGTPFTYEEWHEALVRLVHGAVHPKFKRKESVRQQECVGGIKRKAEDNPEIP